jgi:hypothetical protein
MFDRCRGKSCTHMAGTTWTTARVIRGIIVKIVCDWLWLKPTDVWMSKRTWNDNPRDKNSTKTRQVVGGASRSPIKKRCWPIPLIALDAPGNFATHGAVHHDRHDHFKTV